MEKRKLVVGIPHTDVLGEGEEQDLVGDLDRKIKKAKERVEGDATVLSDEQKERINNLEEQIKQVLNESEKAAEEVRPGVVYAHFLGR